MTEQDSTNSTLHDLDKRVFDAICDGSISQIDAALRTAFEASSYESTCFVNNAFRDQHGWMRALSLINDEDRKDQVFTLLNAWLLNENLQRGRDIDSVREAFSICKSLRRIYTDAELFYEFEHIDLIGLSANSTEAQEQDWKSKITAVRFYIATGTRNEPQCDVIEMFNPRAELSFDHNETSYGSCVRSRPHALACCDCRDFSLYNDSEYVSRSYGVLYVARSKQDLQDWMSQLPGLQEQFDLLIEVDGAVAKEKSCEASHPTGSIARPFEQWSHLVKQYDTLMPLERAVGRPISMASMWGACATVDRLIEAGACPSRKSCDGQNLSPLQVAAMCGKSELIELLVKKHGVDVDERNDQGVTPLMLAVQQRCMESVLTLLDLGADSRTLTHDGRTVMDALKNDCEFVSSANDASRHQDHEIIQVFKAHEAKTMMMNIHRASKSLQAIG